MFVLLVRALSILYAACSDRSPLRPQTATLAPASAKTRPSRPPPPVALRPVKSKGGRRSIAGLVLERNAEPDAVLRDLAVGDRDVEAGRFRNPQVADRLRRRLDGVPGRCLPRLAARPDDLSDAIDAVTHGSSFDDDAAMFCHRTAPCK